jgi:hypothetical protein
MPSANIQRLLELIDPSRTSVNIEQPNHLAREQYPLKKITVDDYDEFLAIAVDYYRHHIRQVMGRTNIGDEEAYGEVRRILDSGQQGGMQTAYASARTGMNGGMSSVLNTLRDYFIQLAEDQYFNHAFLTCVNEMDDEDVEKLMQQYIERNRGFMGQEQAEVRARQLARNAREIIRSHVAYAKRIRTQWHM